MKYYYTCISAVKSNFTGAKVSTFIFNAMHILEAKEYKKKSINRYEYSE